MQVKVWDNYGNYIDYMTTDVAPMVDDLICVGGGWYKVWRRFIVNGNELHVQLGTRLSPSGSQWPRF